MSTPLTSDPRSRFLAETGEILASSLDYKTTLAGVARFVVPEFADWCAIDIVDDAWTKIERLAVAHSDPEKVKWANEIAKKYPPTIEDEEGVPRVIKSGIAELYAEVTDEMLVAGIKDAELLRLMRKMGISSLMIVPLTVRQKSIGAITFVNAESKKQYTEDDLRVAKELGRLASVAIENAQLYQGAKEAALREHEQLALLSTIFRTAPVGFDFLDRNLRFIRVNDFLADLNGKSIEEHAGRTLEEVIPEYAPVLAPILKKILETGEPLLQHPTERDGGPEGIRYFETSYYPVRASNGDIIGIAGISNEVTERKKTEKIIEYQAYHDSLTGLDNRKSFEEKITERLRGAKGRRAKYAALFLDFDQFKNINDTLGHTVGDAVLRELAKRLRTMLREEDIMGRWGGDEFVFFMQVHNVADAIHAAKKILKALQGPVHAESYLLHASGSMGVALFPENGTNAATLLKNADTALYRAKDSGRNNVQIYDPSMNAFASDRMALNEDLRHALLRHQITFHYQAIYDTATNRLAGAEVLARWKHPERGYVPASQFIPLAEEAGSIFSLDEWKLRKSCEQNKEWQDMGFAPFPISANMSAHHLAKIDFIDTVKKILETSELDPKYLELEITESVAMKNTPYIQDALFALKELGVKIAIDDFGTGQTSIGYLKNFPFDTIKIDQQFVKNCLLNTKDAAIVQSMIMLGEKLGVDVIAEGVETKEQLDYLASLGCRKVQGFFLNRPMPARDFTKVIATPGARPGLL